MTPWDSFLKPQDNNNGKEKKDTKKWREFHKTPTHNKNEIFTEHTLGAELNDLNMDSCSNFESESDKGTKKIKYSLTLNPLQL